MPRMDARRVYSRVVDRRAGVIADQSVMPFAGAALLLGERPGWVALAGVLLVVAGIVLVADIGRTPLHLAKAGIAWGVLTGAFIASYTLNDGWAVKYLAVSPVLIDYAGNVFRVLVLAPRALASGSGLGREMREFGRSAMLVGALAPLGYILVLWAMRLAPISHVAPARELATLVGTYFGGRLLKEKDCGGPPDWRSVHRGRRYLSGGIGIAAGAEFCAGLSSGS